MFILKIYQDTKNMANTIYSKKQFRRVYKKRGNYILLTTVLLICIIQFMWGTVYNVLKFLVLEKQIKKIESLCTKAQSKNQDLKRELQVYSSYQGIEELARNNLKMVGKDEVLVLIKPVPAINKNKSKNKKSVFSTD
jgi:cell division protein FtsL